MSTKLTPGQETKLKKLLEAHGEAYASRNDADKKVIKDYIVSFIEDYSLENNLKLTSYIRIVGRDLNEVVKVLESNEQAIIDDYKMRRYKRTIDALRVDALGLSPLWDES